jgi:hypothetical protein
MNMLKRRIGSLWFAAASLLPLAATGATLSLELSAPAVRVGETVDVRLRIGGLGAATVWDYQAFIEFDAQSLQLGPVFWGDGMGSNQLSCPGATPAGCTHVGSSVWIGYPWTSVDTLYMAEASQASQALLQAEQLDDFIVLRLGFTALREGSTGIAASLLFREGPFAPETPLLAPPASVLVQLPEPASTGLALAGLAAALALGSGRRRPHLRLARGCAAS